MPADDETSVVNKRQRPAMCLQAWEALRRAAASSLAVEVARTQDHTTLDRHARKGAPLGAFGLRTHQKQPPNRGTRERGVRLQEAGTQATMTPSVASALLQQTKAAAFFRAI